MLRCERTHQSARASEQVSRRMVRLVSQKMAGSQKRQSDRPEEARQVGARRAELLKGDLYQQKDGEHAEERLKQHNGCGRGGCEAAKEMEDGGDQHWIAGRQKCRRTRRSAKGRAQSMACQKRLGKKTQLPMERKNHPCGRLRSTSATMARRVAKASPSIVFRWTPSHFAPRALSRPAWVSASVVLTADGRDTGRPFHNNLEQARGEALRCDPHYNTALSGSCLQQSLAGEREAAVSPSCRLQSRSGRSLSVRSLHPLLTGELHQDSALQSPRCPESLPCTARPRQLQPSPTSPAPPTSAAASPASSRRQTRNPSAQPPHRVARIDFTITGSEFEPRLRSTTPPPPSSARRGPPPPAPAHVLLPPLHAGQPSPRVYSTNRLSRRALAHTYGPFPSRAAADRYCDAVLDLFKLRRCHEDLAPNP